MFQFSFSPTKILYDSLQGYGGYAGFHFSLLLALLLDQRKITALMSSYQILRVALQTVGIVLLPPWCSVCLYRFFLCMCVCVYSLATSDWSTAGVSMATQDPPLVMLVAECIGLW